MRSKRLSAALHTMLVGAASVVGALAPAVPVFAAVQTCDWTGAGSDKNFSTVANWTNCGGAAPQAGDIIAFDRANVTANDSLVNDLGVALGGMQVTQNGGSTNNYGADIDTIHFESGATWSQAQFETGFNMYPSQVTADGDINLTKVSYGSISTSGIVTLDGAWYYPTGGETHTKIILKNGSQVVTNPSSGGAKTFSPVIQADTGGGTFVGYAFCADPHPMGCGAYDATSWTLNGAVANSQLKVLAGPSATVNISGSGSIVKDDTSEGVVKINGIVVTNAAKSTSITGVQATTDVTVVENETATLAADAERQVITVLNGGILKGTGKMDTLLVSQGGKVAPGMSPGCLTATGALSLSGEYDFELGGADACTGYDQIKAGGVTINTTASLVTSRYNNYTPTQGQVFTIIDNQINVSIPVNGTFQGLAEGAVFEQNGVQFRISYKGGDGNDVTLTVMNQPTVPDTGFTLMRANPALTLIGSVIAAAGLLLVGRRVRSER